MTADARGKLRPKVDLIAEVALIGRFTESYRRKVSNMIGRMNGEHGPATDLASLRLCVEAVDMMLSSQKQLCSALAAITDGKQGAA